MIARPHAMPRLKNTSSPGRNRYLLYCASWSCLNREARPKNVGCKTGGVESRVTTGRTWGRGGTWATTWTGAGFGMFSWITGRLGSTTRDSVVTRWTASFWIGGSSSYLGTSIMAFGTRLLKYVDVLWCANLARTIIRIPAVISGEPEQMWVEIGRAPEAFPRSLGVPVQIIILSMIGIVCLIPCILYRFTVFWSYEFDILEKPVEFWQGFQDITLAESLVVIKAGLNEWCNTIWTEITKTKERQGKEAYSIPKKTGRTQVLVRIK